MDRQDDLGKNSVYHQKITISPLKIKDGKFIFTVDLSKKGRAILKKKNDVGKRIIQKDIMGNRTMKKKTRIMYQFER